MVAQGITLAGRYRLDTRIGAGGMGEVWRGEDIVLARTVAVKVLLPGRMDDPGFVARFQGEARAMATVNHRGVVDVYDYGVSEVAGAGATVYLVMKFVDGEPLDRLLARIGSIAPEPAMELIAQAASALQAVHDQGIVHRDVKPGNLLVQRDGTLVITDFGIARADVASRLTDAGMVLGTAAYCAPEQAEGAPVTPAVDIYALGVVAYECLVGVRPFDGDSPVTIALKHIREAPPPLPMDIPAPVRALVERALAKDPALRFPSAAAMSAAAHQAVLPPDTGAAPLAELSPMTGAMMVPPVEAYQTGSQQSAPDATTAAAPGSRRRRAAKARRRGGLVAGIAAAVVLGVGAGAVAISGAAWNSAPPVDAGNSGATVPLPTSPSPTKATKPPGRKPSPTITPTQPTRRAEPTQTPTTKASPTISPSPTVTPTTTPTTTPTPGKKKAVPGVVNMRYEEAKKVIWAAGFKVKIDDQTGGDVCRIVAETNPAKGVMLELGKPVELVLIQPLGECPTPTPSPTPSATKS